MDFGSQVGKQNGAKIDPTRHPKNDEKEKGSRITKKLEKVPATPSDWRGPGSRALILQESNGGGINSPGIKGRTH